MKTIRTRSHNAKAIDEIVETLKDGNTVRVENEHETLYGGLGFKRWIEDELSSQYKPIPCTIDIVAWDSFYGFESVLIITPKNV